MPITGRTLAGAGLQGLGEGLQQWSAQTIKRKQIQDEWAFELYKQQLAQQAARETAQQGRQDKLLEGLIAHPEDTAAQLDLAPLLMPNAKPDDLARLRDFGLQHGTQQFLQRLNTLGKPEDAPADLAIAMSRATGKDYGSMPPTVDAAQWGGEQAESSRPNELLQAINAQRARIAQLNAAEQDKIARLGETKRVEAYGTGTGTAAAKHEGAPTALADEIAAITGKGPVEAEAAGLKRHAEDMAGVAPDVTAGKAAQTTATELAKVTPAVIAGEANLAGAKKGAEDRAAAGVKYDPANMANQIKLAVDQAQALAAAKGDTARKKYITDAQVGALRLGPQLAIAKDLYDRATKGDLAAAKLYHDKVESLAAPIAMATGFTGRMSVQEMHNVSGLLPSLVADTALGTAKEKWNNLEATMRYGPLIASQLPIDATVSDALGAVQALVDLEKKARAGGGALPAASTPAPAPARHFDFNPATNQAEPR